jgi:hypothetical protein
LRGEDEFVVLAESKRTWLDTLFSCKLSVLLGVYMNLKKERFVVVMLSHTVTPTAGSPEKVTKFIIRFN